MRDKLLTTREVSHILKISEKDVIDLTRSNKIRYLKIAGEFLRFRKDDIINLKQDIQNKFNSNVDSVSSLERWKDFLYFNDFYIISSIIIIILLWVIFKE